MFHNQRYSNSISSTFMQKVYGWMCVGLSVTAAISYYLSPEVNPVLFKALMSNMFMVFGLFIAQFALIYYMMSHYQRISFSAMALSFMTFCALQGISLAPLLYVYTGASVFYVFMIAAVMFAVMGLYGWLTNSDLSSMGNILFMGLIGLIIANFINIFIRSAMFDMFTAVIGVGIFSMLIAYDIQNLKKYSQYGVSSPEDMNKFALIGAMALYLNLINLFIYLLRLFGERRRD